MTFTTRHIVQKAKCAPVRGKTTLTVNAQTVGRCIQRHEITSLGADEPFLMWCVVMQGHAGDVWYPTDRAPHHLRYITMLGKRCCNQRALDVPDGVIVQALQPLVDPGSVSETRHRMRDE